MRREKTQISKIKKQKKWDNNKHQGNSVNHQEQLWETISK
jgi:hypothetical protein